MDYTNSLSLRLYSSGLNAPNDNSIRFKACHLIYQYIIIMTITHCSNYKDKTFHFFNLSKEASHVTLSGVHPFLDMDLMNSVLFMRWIHPGQR